MKKLYTSRNNFFFLLVSFVFLIPAKEFCQNNCDNTNMNCAGNEFQKSGNPVYSVSSVLSIIRVIPSPTNGTAGMALQDSFLWVGSYPNQIFKISTSNGAVLKTLNTNILRPYGIAYVNGFLWVADDDLNKINKVDTSNGNTVFSFNAFPGGFVMGLAWDGTHLWHNDGLADSTYVFDTLGTKISAHKINLSMPSSLSFQNNYLWSGDNVTNKLYKIDTASFIILDTIHSPKQFPNGLAFDGQYMWVAENENSAAMDSIYLIGLGNDQSLSTTLTNYNETLLVYPNPSSGIFYAELAMQNEIASIEIYNSIGEKIFSDRINKPQSINTQNKITLDLSVQPAGIYFVNAISAGKRSSKKIIIQK